MCQQLIEKAIILLKSSPFKEGFMTSKYNAEVACHSNSDAYNTPPVHNYCLI